MKTTRPNSTARSSPARALVRALLAAAAATLVAAVLLPGCGPDRACFEWSPGVGACPTQDDALEFFGGDCSDIKTVDSKPELLDDSLCCYDVTHWTGTHVIPPGASCKPPAQ